LEKVIIWAWRSDWSKFHQKPMNDIQFIITVLMHAHVLELILELLALTLVILLSLLRRVNPACVLARCAIQTAVDLQCSSVDLIVSWEDAVNFHDTANHRKCHLIVSQAEEDLTAAKRYFRKHQFCEAMEKAKTAQHVFRSAQPFLPPALIITAHD
jgi:hypothetical protein